MAPYAPSTSLLTPGRIGQATWSAALLAGSAHRDEGPPLTGAQAAEIVAAYHEEAPKLGLNHDLALAQGVVESACFTSALWRTRRNPCGLGITGPGVVGKDYGTVRNGIVAHLHHLCCYAYSLATCPVQHVGSPDPRHDFHDGNPRLSHLQEPLPGRRWAEEPGYVGKILAIVNALLLAADTPGPTKETIMAKIALASGHHNSSGGDAFEYQQTGELCEAVARACVALGMDVRVVQPDGPDADSEPGDGTIAGSLDVVGNTVVAWAKAGWVPDIFLECHTEGGGGVGVFAIYPDAPGDVDADVRDTLGPDVARRVAAATGLGVGGRQNGTMSERQTGVGGDGFRLGIFRTTAPIASTTTRLIIEYGAHDKQPDLAIVKRPGFFDAAGKATAVAFAAFLGLPTQPNAGSVVEAPAAPEVSPHGPAADDPEIHTYLNAQGEAIVEIVFGGKASKLLGVNIVDVGVSVQNDAGETYDRTIRANAFEPWHKR